MFLIRALIVAMEPQSVDPFVYVRLTGRGDSSVFLRPKYCDAFDTASNGDEDDDVKVLHTFRNGVLCVDDNGSDRIKGIQPTVPGLVEAAMFVGETDGTVYQVAREYADVPVTTQVRNRLITVSVASVCCNDKTIGQESLLTSHLDTSGSHRCTSRINTQAHSFTVLCVVCFIST